MTIKVKLAKHYVLRQLNDLKEWAAENKYFKDVECLNVAIKEIENSKKEEF